MEHSHHALLAVLTDMSRVCVAAVEGELATGIREGGATGRDSLFEFGVLLEVRCWRLWMMLHRRRHRS